MFNDLSSKVFAATSTDSLPFPGIPPSVNVYLTPLAMVVAALKFLIAGDTTSVPTYTIMLSLVKLFDL